MPNSEHKAARKPVKGMGTFRDAAGRLWKFWRDRWRRVKEAGK